MYKFSRVKIPGFLLVQSSPSIGDTHLKKFGEGATPLNQGTMNIYIKGEFTYSIPDIGFTQVMEAGNTNLDLNLDAFPSGSICIEEAITNAGLRLCLSPEDITARWERNINIISADQDLQLNKGDLLIVIEGTVFVGANFLSSGGVFYAELPAIIKSISNSKILVARLL